MCRHDYRVNSKVAVVFLLALFYSTGYAQNKTGFDLLKQEATHLQVDTSQELWRVTHPVNTKGEINYINPILYQLRLKDTLQKQMGKWYYEVLGTLLSFIGDVANAKNEFIKSGDFEVTEKIDTTKYNQTALIAASPYIYQQAKLTSFVLINEAHHQPQYRLFTTTLLKNLKEIGYSYLALEGLTNHKDIGKVEKATSTTGYYTLEPMYADLVREAVSLGYQLIPYEDTVITNSDIQRDSAQAANILSVFNKDPKAKVLIHAGYGHIEENHSPPKRMGSFLKKWSGIDPFTIDQMTFSDGSGNNFSNSLYRYWENKFHFKMPVIVTEKSFPWHFEEQQLYDVYVLHPKITYINNRPSWLTYCNYRTPKWIEVPKKLNEKIFLIQAYLASEIDNEGVDKCIPFDQTYNTRRKPVQLYLKPHSNYRIVYRDIHNLIIGEQLITQER